MHLGFIGTGEISKAVILGILKSKIKYKKIFISKRNNKISNFLKKQSKKVIILNNNQEILNKSRFVFLAITPEVGRVIIPKLDFKKKKYCSKFYINNKSE